MEGEAGWGAEERGGANSSRKRSKERGGRHGVLERWTLIAGT